jgi:hypothetical protein
MVVAMRATMERTLTNLKVFLFANTPTIRRIMAKTAKVISGRAAKASMD